jgi:tripartite-type tricarboxylate transporter receptor subunit TctC
MRGMYGVIAAILTLAGPATAQGPQKPIQIVVPFVPGASADGIARIIANGLTARTGRQVIVENKPGGGGAIGLMAVAKSAPDGDTLGIGAAGATVINPHIPGAPANFDPLRDIVPVAKLMELPIIVVANPAAGPKSVRELIERSKATPGGLSYGSTGVNSLQHLGMELLKKQTGANLVHVPYRGSTPAVTDVLGGQTLVASVDLTSALPHIQAGKLTALGMTTARRSAIAPDIPTIAEGGVPGFGISAGFLGLFAPAGTPAAVVKQLTREVAAILAEPDAAAKVRLLAADVAYEDDVTFAKFLASESQKWKEAIQGMNLSN